MNAHRDQEPFLIPDSCPRAEKHSDQISLESLSPNAQLYNLEVEVVQLPSGEQTPKGSSNGKFLLVEVIVIGDIIITGRSARPPVHQLREEHPD